jgi:hypothetical protein
MARFLIGLCGFAVGLIAGLLIASIAGTDCKLAARLKEAEEHQAAAEKACDVHEAFAGYWRNLFVASVSNMKEASPRTNETLDKRSTPHGVRRWRVSGVRATEVFRVSRRPWRLCWTTEEHVLICVCTQDGEIVATASGDNGNGQSVIHTDPGDYYLQIVSLGPSTVSVNDET